MFVQRDMQYGDPFYFWYGENLFTEDYADLLTSPKEASFFNYVEEHGPLSFIDTFNISIISLSSKSLFPENWISFNLY